MSQTHRIEKKQRPIPLPRQKACNACSQAKVRCDHKPKCTRCEVRSLDCVYPLKTQTNVLSGRPSIEHSPQNAATYTVLDPEESYQSPESLQLQEGAAGRLGPAIESPNLVSSGPNAWTRNDVSAPHRPTRPRAGVDELICSIDPTAIQTRWLNAFIPEADQQPKVAPPAVNHYVAKILKSYAGSIIRNGVNGLPPFVHAKQPGAVADDSPLLKCITLSRLCDKGNSTMAREILESEMLKVFETRSSLDGNHLLCAFQAYLLYVKILHFQLCQEGIVLQQHVINLQQLACDACSVGTVTTAELDHARPQWTPWIVAESKRRTLYTMYLFDNLLCVGDNMPVFIATELRGLPAPAGRLLWRVSSEDMWRTSYNHHLAEWNDSGLRLDELWKPEGLGSAALQRRNDRIDRWLEEADEFCIMLYAVTSGTHGG